MNAQKAKGLIVRHKHLEQQYKEAEVGVANREDDLRIARQCLEVSQARVATATKDLREARDKRSSAKKKLDAAAPALAKAQRAVAQHDEFLIAADKAKTDLKAKVLEHNKQHGDGDMPEDRAAKIAERMVKDGVLRAKDDAARHVPTEEERQSMLDQTRALEAARAQGP
jgi:hypothetical protein